MRSRDKDLAQSLSILGCVVAAMLSGSAVAAEQADEAEQTESCSIKEPDAAICVAIKERRGSYRLPPWDTNPITTTYTFSSTVNKLLIPSFSSSSAYGMAITVEPATTLRCADKLWSVEHLPSGQVLGYYCVNESRAFQTAVSKLAPPSRSDAPLEISFTELKLNRQKHGRQNGSKERQIRPKSGRYHFVAAYKEVTNGIRLVEAPLTLSDRPTREEHLQARWCEAERERLQLDCRVSALEMNVADLKSKAAMPQSQSPSSNGSAR